MNITGSNSPKWISFLRRTPTEITLETCAFVLIGIVSIIGNFLVIVSVCRNRSLRTSTNYLALSLAITDILYPVTIVPLSVFWLIDLKDSHFIERYGQAVCDFQAIWFFTLLNASGYTITLMAFNRFICVCKTTKYKQMFTKRKTLLMNSGLWMLCFIVAVLLVKGNFFYAKFFPQEVMCNISRRNKTMTTKIIGNILNGASIVAPYTVMLYCYIKIFLKIREHRKNVSQATSSNQSTLGAHDIKITWTLFAVLLGYLLLWLPVLIVGIAASHNKALPHHVTIILPIFIACSSAINPIIYGVMSPAFRREYFKIFRSIAHSTSHFFSTTHNGSSRRLTLSTKGL